MEAESGCQIHVAGKGSLRNKVVRPDSGLVPDEDDLHVFIQGDSQEKVNKAVDIVSKLLVPQNTQAIAELRKNQLRELAKIQGTIIQESYCSICGQKGHNQYECPSRQKNKKNEIRCSICGDLGHLTMDCKFKNTLDGGKDTYDTAYNDFMKELGVADDDNTTTPFGNTQTSSEWKAPANVEPYQIPQSYQPMYEMPVQQQQYQQTGMIPTIPFPVQPNQMYPPPPPQQQQQGCIFLYI